MGNSPGQRFPAGQAPQAPTVPQRGQAGVGDSNFQSVYAMHVHDGSNAGGGLLYGPYFIKDKNGVVWKFGVTTNGVLSATAGGRTVVSSSVAAAALAFSAQTSVTIVHGLGHYPIVQVLDAGGNIVTPDAVTHSSVNAFTVSMNPALTGTVIWLG